MKHAWLPILLAAAGCVDLKAAYPDRRFYTVEASRTGAERATSPQSVLRVRRFNASKMCDGNELVTRTADAVYESDFYNVLFVPPAQQVQEQTAHWLSRSKLYGLVVGAGSSVPDTHTLEGNLVSLHGDYRKPGSPLAVIEVQFLLVKVTGEPAAAMAQRSYRQEIALPDQEPGSLVKGWSEGLGKILGALEADLARVK